LTLSPVRAIRTPGTIVYKIPYPFCSAILSGSLLNHPVSGANSGPLINRSPIKEETLSLRLKYQTILSQLAPAGAVGVSLALGAASPAAASEPPAGAQPSTTEREKVAERLAAVRDAVSALDQQKADDLKSDGRLAWGNFGFGWGWPNWSNWPNWRNWRNWGNWFRNW
jgi:hypothetical protein